MSRADLRTAASVVGILTVAGVAAGVLWWWVAPQPTYRVAADGLYLVAAQPQEYVAADGWFAIITAAVGAAAGVTVWLRCRTTGPGAVLGLFLGGLLGAGSTAAVGLLLGRADPFAAPIGAVTQGALELRAWAVLLLEAGLGLTVWLLLDLLVLREEPAADTDLAEPPPREDRPGYGAVRDL